MCFAAPNPSPHPNPPKTPPVPPPQTEIQQHNTHKQTGSGLVNKLYVSNVLKNYATSTEVAGLAAKTDASIKNVAATYNLITKTDLNKAIDPLPTKSEVATSIKDAVATYATKVELANAIKNVTATSSNAAVTKADLTTAIKDAVTPLATKAELSDTISSKISAYVTSNLVPTWHMPAFVRATVSVAAGSFGSGICTMTLGLNKFNAFYRPLPIDIACNGKSIFVACPRGFFILNTGLTNTATVSPLAPSVEFDNAVYALPMKNDTATTAATYTLTAMCVPLSAVVR